MTPVPLLDLGPQNRALAADLRAAFERVLGSNQFIMGPELEAFERSCAEALSVKHAFGVSSGTDALLLGLMALDVGPGDEVLLPAFTFFATAGSVARLGATPVWCDVDPHTFNLDLADVARKAGPKSKVLMPVHLFGQSMDMDATLAVAQAANMKVLEDGAQSMGARWKGKPSLSFGEFGASSFFPSKNLGGFGDSGLLVTSHDDLAAHARILRVHGMEPKYHHKLLGANFRMDPLQAAMLRAKLPHLPAYNCDRAGNAHYYHQRLLGAKGIAENVPGAPADARILLPRDFSGEGIWNQFTLRIPGGRRDAFKAFLTERKIGCEVYYPITLDRQECFKGVGRGGETCTVSHQLATEVVSIPIFPEMTEAQRTAVGDALEVFGAVG